MSALKISRLLSSVEQPVYDIAMPTHHNFVLNNGVIAHNCSHSTSYAVLAYNQCWLKYHYPLCWWAGFLSCNGGEQEKIREVLPECRQYLDPPDITRSRGTKWRIIGGRLVASLQVKGVGPKTAEDVATWYSLRQPKTLDELCAALKADKAKPVALGKVVEYLRAQEATADIKDRWQSSLATVCAEELVMRAEEDLFDVPSAGTWLTLLYAGALDSLLPDRSVAGVHRAADAIRKALGSKAGMTEAKENRGESIAMKDIADSVDLHVWRYEHIPMYTFDMASLLDEELQKRGFGRCASSVRPYASSEWDIWTCWSDLFAPGVYEYYSDWESLRGACVVGLVTKRERRVCKNGKPMLSVSVFTGVETIDLAVWSEYKTGVLDVDKIAPIQVGKLLLLNVRPNKWGSRKSGSIKSVVSVLR